PAGGRIPTSPSTKSGGASSTSIAIRGWPTMPSRRSGARRRPYAGDSRTAGDRPAFGVPHELGDAQHGPALLRRIGVVDVVCAAFVEEHGIVARAPPRVVARDEQRTAAVHHVDPVAVQVGAEQRLRATDAD